jgi:hypothetical protein
VRGSGGRPVAAMLRSMDTPNIPKNTNAFYMQAAISFAVALLTMVFSVFYLPVDVWIRAFLGLGIMYLTTSAFTLAKCVRDAQENQAVYARLDQARVEKILAEHDPFKAVV